MRSTLDLDGHTWLLADFVESEDGKNVRHTGSDLVPLDDLERLVVDLQAGDLAQGNDLACALLLINADNADRGSHTDRGTIDQVTSAQVSQISTSSISC